MPQSKDDTYRELKRDAKRHCIEVNSAKYNRLTSSGVPTEHQEKFDVVQSLGRQLYDKLGFVPDVNTPDKPWQLETKQRAARLMKYATWHREENSNESEWRGIEHSLFERFNIEVACKRCRKRLWRSEIEADPRSSNSRTTRLEERQKMRQPCKCNPNGSMDNHPALDPGLTNLFSYRLERTCLAPDDPASSPRKRPDRTHGLRQTQNFEDILRSPYAHDGPEHTPRRLVENVVKTTLNPDNGGSPLLFPFLLLEAKREKCAENFEEMETQTCFPIKYALDLQYRLLHTPGNTMDVPGGPLVWFFANRGDDWRVYAAHIQEREGRLRYIINHLWGGSITGIDEMLQLILIIDYIIDWARDVYRPNILRQLKMLSKEHCNDSRTFEFDPDILSLPAKGHIQGKVQQWIEGQAVDPKRHVNPPHAEAKPVSPVEDTFDPLDRFKTEDGIVRNARHIQSRLRGLIVTRDNLDTLLQSFENPKDVEEFKWSVFSALDDSCVALESEDVLDAVEDRWTGYTRIRPKRLDQRPEIYVQFRISFYINAAWEQVRELAYLAVAHDTIDFFTQTEYYWPCPDVCCTTDLISAIDRFRRSSVRKDIVSSLCRRTYMIDDRPIKAAFLVEGNGTIHKAEKPPLAIKHDRYEFSPSALMRNLVHTVYEKYRIGNRELSEPFLRTSIRVDMDGRALWQGWKEGDCLPNGQLHLDTILAYASPPKGDYIPYGAGQKYCLYILDGQQDLEHSVIVTKLNQAIKDKRVYRTVRRSRAHRYNRGCDDNLKRYWFDMRYKKSWDKLKLPLDQFKLDVRDWSMALLTRSQKYD